MACRMHQKAIALKVGAKDNHYQSGVLVYESVFMKCRQIILQPQSIGFSVFCCFFFRIMSHMLGFTRVFRLMVSHNKILVGHNHFMDLMILYEKFYKPLPGMIFSLHKLVGHSAKVVNKNILSRASEVGSPTNHLGSGQRRDTDQGPFSPCLVAARSQGGSSEAPPRWHATICYVDHLG